MPGAAIETTYLLSDKVQAASEQHAANLQELLLSCDEELSGIRDQAAACERDAVSEEARSTASYFWGVRAHVLRRVRSQLAGAAELCR